MDENTKINKFPKIGDIIIYSGKHFWYKAIWLADNKIFFIDHCNKYYKKISLIISRPNNDYFLNEDIKIF